MARRWTLNDDIVLREMAAEGATTLDIGKKLGRSPLAVSARSDKLGIRVKMR